MMNRLVLLLCLTLSLWAVDDANLSKPLSSNDQLLITSLENTIGKIDNELKDNTWLTRYSNFLTYQKLIEELTAVDKTLTKVQRRRDDASIEQAEVLEKRQVTLEKQLELLNEFKRSPFAQMIKPPNLSDAPKITNPLAIISGFSYIKQLQTERGSYKERLDGLGVLINKLKTKEELIVAILEVIAMPKYIEELGMVRQEIEEFSAAQDISETTYSVYEKKIDEAILRTTDNIQEQMKRAFNIGIFIVLVIVMSLLFKFGAKKYITDNERFYMANKIINFINVTLIILILLFAYIENVTYLVTVVGFASAGIAIAMKDMFMSVLGWMVIVFGGSFHVGDRVKVQKDGLPYVGDIIDISLLRMTILEDITLTSYMENRRTGRIVFIPNNYIFTTLISNYTHMTMKTVWDGIDLTITFDSNYKKAMYIIKNITKKYSKGYTDIARKQLNMLRNQYSLKNTNVEPRIFSFLEPHGLTISTWYQTNSYAALTLRSTLSAEIIEAINKEDDITIAFPTQTLHLKSAQPKGMPPLDINKDVLY